MHNILIFCQNFSPLTPEAAEDLAQNISSKTYKKGKHVLKKNQTCENIYFINEGLLKVYFSGNNKEFVMRFFTENTMFSVFDSFISQMPSKATVIALEDTTITSISHESLEKLCKKHHCMETLYRKLVSVATLKMTNRIREMLAENAKDRYTQFVKENSKIIQRLPVGDIAKYLGITQQSLSRIRKVK